MKRQYGFGLIEVMLAFIIVAATAGTLLQLNKTYLEYSRDGRSREVAMRLAESKLDELRRFQSRTGFETIVSGSDSVILDDIEYDRDWTVTDYSWDKDSCASPDDCWVPSPSKKDTGKKNVAVLVGWEDVDVMQSFSLDSVISPNTPASGGPFGTSGDSFGSGKGGPKVLHNPGAIPDIISIELDPATGIRQETTKPAPDIQTGQYAGDVVVSFESVVFDPSSNTLLKGDSRTLYCSCQTETGDESRFRPAVPVSLAQSIYWEKSSTISKPWGSSKNNNPDCDVCCQNHYDVPGSDLFEDKYNQFNDSHTHDPGDYNEACRELRIDGYYLLMPDWNLVALNVFPPGYLSNADNVGLYQKYVKFVVKDYVTKMKSKVNSVNYEPDSFRTWLGSNGTSDEKKAFNDLTELYVSSSYQFAARAIYVDHLPESLLDLIDFEKDNWLTRVSFNEVNVTLLADWKLSVADDVYLDVTNEDINTIVDPENDYFGTYSRGYVTGEQVTLLLTSASVTAEMKRYNSGLTGGVAISDFDGSNIFTSSLHVEVIEGSISEVTFDGVIQCLTTANPNSTSAISCSRNDFSKTIVTVTDSSGVSKTCTVNKEADVATASYQCTVSAGTDVTLSFREDSSNSKFVFNSGAVNPKTISLSALDITAGNIPCILQISKNITDYGTITCSP